MISAAPTKSKTNTHQFKTSEDICNTLTQNLRVTKLWFVPSVSETTQTWMYAEKQSFLISKLYWLACFNLVQNCKNSIFKPIFVLNLLGQFSCIRENSSGYFCCFVDKFFASYYVACVTFGSQCNNATCEIIAPHFSVPTGKFKDEFQTRWGCM